MNIKIAHIADTHLGYRQYGLIEREKDFYDSFNNIIDDIIDKDIDYVIHAGDLFESSRPPVEAISVAQKGFNRLRENNIPVYAIAGNHDIMQKHKTVLPQELFTNDNFHILSLNNNQVILEDCIYLGGLPYLSKKYENNIIKTLYEMKDEASKYPYSMLMLHGTVSKYVDFQPEFELNTIPEGFDYYAMGHLHKRILEDFKGGTLCYSGSTEIRSKDELDSYEKDSKGYTLVTIDDSEESINAEYVNIPLEREFITKVINYGNLEESLDKLRDTIEDKKKKPLVYLTVNNGSFEKSEVYNIVNQKLENLTLKTNITYEPIDDTMDIVYDKDLLTPEKAIELKLEEHDNEFITNLGLDLYRSRDESLDTRLDIAEDYYKKIYGKGE